MNKTFTPEKVRELSGKLYHCPLPVRENVIAEWLEENQPEPVVVGLSDEQVYEISRCACEIGFDVGRTSIQNIIDIVSNYLKTQTFTQLKQFTPNWDDAPFAVEFQLRKVWISAQGNELEELPICFYRPKPTPQVEVGQVWKNHNNGKNYKILMLGKLKESGVWLDAVTYGSADDNYYYYTRTLSDFLAKFERMGGRNE